MGMVSATQDFLHDQSGVAMGWQSADIILIISATCDIVFLLYLPFKRQRRASGLRNCSSWQRRFQFVTISSCLFLWFSLSKSIGSLGFTFNCFICILVESPEFLFAAFNKPCCIVAYFFPRRRWFESTVLLRATSISQTFGLCYIISCHLYTM